MSETKLTSEEAAEAFIQAAVDRAPEPLRRLGEWLAGVLDEDDWETAERMLLGAAVGAAEDDPRNAFEEWAHADHRDCAAQEFEDRTPENNLYYADDTTNHAYIGWKAGLAALSEKGRE